MPDERESTKKEIQTPPPSLSLHLYLFVLSTSLQFNWFNIYTQMNVIQAIYCNSVKSMLHHNVTSGLLQTG